MSIYPSNLQLFIAAAATVLLLVAAWQDVVTRTIPDVVCIALAILGIAGRVPDGGAAVALSVGVGVAVFLLLSIPAAFGAMGGGDVKLIAALAIGLPPLGVWQLIATIAYAGGGLAVLYWAARRLPLPRLRAGGDALHRVLAVERWRACRAAPLPYGVAIAIGGALTLLAPLGG